MTHYQTLGLDKNATHSDIKKSYRSKAQKNHPDRGGDESLFMQIQRAYDTLSDLDKRDHYDRTGQDDKPSMEDEANARLSQLFSELIIRDSQRGDMVKAAINAVIQSSCTLQSRTGSNDALIKSLGKRRDRIKRKTEGPNLYIQAIDGKVAALDQDNKVIAHEIELNTTLMAMLEEYSDTGIGALPVFQTGGV
jgi:DnaJ-class molecular chaperone